MDKELRFILEQGFGFNPTDTIKVEGNLANKIIRLENEETKLLKFLEQNSEHMCNRQFSNKKYITEKFEELEENSFVPDHKIHEFMKNTYVEMNSKYTIININDKPIGYHINSILNTGIGELIDFDKFVQDSEKEMQNTYKKLSQKLILDPHYALTQPGLKEYEHTTLQVLPEINDNIKNVPILSRAIRYFSKTERKK